MTLEWAQTLGGNSLPMLFGGLVALAVGLGWMAFRPAGDEGRQDPESRLDSYLRGRDIVEEEILRKPFAERAVLPVLRKVVRALGRLTPTRNLEGTEQMLVRAGEPMGLSVIDFYGLRLFVAAAAGLGYLLLLGQSVGLVIALRNAALLGLIAFILPQMWLRLRVSSRQNEIQKALPDALDMLTIGVEAGLGFESAMMRVGEHWDNALTHEFRRAVAEMRVGMSREEALRRMSQRSGVQDLHTFVAVLIQSSRLGVSIADVLHTQSYQMRLRRRQRAQEQAQKAAIKMVFPLVFFIFPAMFVVILGPAIPRLVGMFSNL